MILLNPSKEIQSWEIKTIKTIIQLKDIFESLFTFTFTFNMSELLHLSQLLLRLI